MLPTFEHNEDNHSDSIQACAPALPRPTSPDLGGRFNTEPTGKAFIIFCRTVGRSHGRSDRRRKVGRSHGRSEARSNG